MKTKLQQGRFSWNLGGLIGSAVGFSSWMAITPFWADWDAVGIVAALVCVVLILITVPVLWRMRAKIDAFRGIIVLLVVAFISSSIFLASAHLMNLTVLTSWPPRLASASECLWGLLVFPALGVLFWLINQRTKTKEREQVGAGDAEEAV